MSDDLERAIHDAAVALGQADLYATDLPALLAALDALKDLREDIRILAGNVEHRAGELMDDRRATVDGVEWQRSRPPLYGEWRHDDLLAAVLDSRLVNEDTGELVEETQLDRVRHVWGLAGYQARKGALRERGLKPSDFAEVTWPEDADARWKVSRVADKRGRRKSHE